MSVRATIRRSTYREIIERVGLDPTEVTHMAFTPDGVIATVLSIDRNGFVQGEPTTVYIPVED